MDRMPIRLEEFVGRRTRELYYSTRAEIAMSIAAAVVLAGVVAWRFAAVHDRLPEVGWLALLVALGWAAISAWWYRDRLRRAAAPRGEALAASGLDFYRRELERRRRHLRDEWLWHGPLFLACVVFAAIVAGKAFPGVDRFRAAAPLIGLLVVWTGFGVWRRVRQAKELQLEIGDIERMGRAGRDV